MIQVIPGDDFFCYRPATDVPTPTVIHIPGFNQDARSHADFALRLVEAGFQCVILNPPWRNTPNLSNPNPAILFNLFDQTDKLLDNILQHLCQDKHTDLSRVTITGFSMGGMFLSRRLTQTNPAGAMPHPFRAGALILSCGDWSFLPRTTLNAFPHLSEIINPATVSMIEQLLRQQSPVATPEAFPPLPLLLINVDQDPRLPLEFAQGFYDTLLEVYEEQGVADKLQFNIHKGKRHEFRRTMQHEVRDWLLTMR